jgi:hypothetical protein
MFTDFLELHKPDEATLEKMDYAPETPFALARTWKDTSPEVYADYITFITVVVSFFLALSILLFGG